MCKIQRKYWRFLRPSIFMILLLSCNISYSQYFSGNDTIKKIPPGVLNKIRENISLISKEFLLSMPSAILPAPIPIKDKNIVFFDSLKVRASKSLITKRLYSFMVLNTDTVFKKQFTTTSDANYIKYSGKKIRKIIIQRLNVFGADINNPSSENPNKIENVLNKTHVNTNENIIRKNLLF